MESILLGALGLSGAAGLNAWMPLLIVAIAGRSGAIDLSDPYEQLTTNTALVIVSVGFVVDFIGDEIPAVDHALHAIGNAIHPAAGDPFFVFKSSFIYTDKSGFFAGGLRCERNN